MPKLKVPEGGESCSFNGQEYEVDDCGCVDVPAEAVADLLEHGFLVPTAEEARAHDSKKAKR